MDSLNQQLKTIIAEYGQELDEEIQKALTVSGDYLITQLKLSSPVDSSNSGEHLRDCWAMKTKYHNVRYVGNTKQVHDGIPLINLLEYGSKGHPFVATTFELNKNQIFDIFKNNLGGK